MARDDMGKLRALAGENGYRLDKLPRADAGNSSTKKRVRWPCDTTAPRSTSFRRYCSFGQYQATRRRPCGRSLEDEKQLVLRRLHKGPGKAQD